ncbi:MAG: response regulator [Patescibacteria group bacterium]|nr:response regulator [Patescibacteria group bacterium]
MIGVESLHREVCSGALVKWAVHTVMRISYLAIEPSSVWRLWIGDASIMVKPGGVVAVTGTGQPECRERCDRMLTVLLVEDDSDLREIFSVVLSNGLAGCTLCEAATGREVLTLLEEQTPDLMLLDVQLPDFSGISLYNLLRLRPDLREVPVLFVTANPQLVHEAALDGPYACLGKPFSLDMLVERAYDLLCRYSTLGSLGA